MRRTIQDMENQYERFTQGTKGIWTFFEYKSHREACYEEDGETKLYDDFVIIVK